MPLPKTASVGIYAGVVGTFLRTILQIMTGVPRLSYHISLTTHQRTLGAALLSELSRGECDQYAMEALHHFLYALYEHQPHENTHRTCPWTQYLSLRALQDSGNFITPELTTGIFAKIKYMANIIVMVQADLLAPSHPDGMIGYVE